MLTWSLTPRVGLPTLRGWRTLGPLIRYGLSFQASWFTFVAREQGINVVVGLLGGIASLGVWTFANRIFALPSIAFNSLYTVGFPAMSNLLAHGEDAAPVIRRTVRRAAIVATLIFPAFAAAAPSLVPVVFGSQWGSAADIFPFICLSTILLGSIAVASTSYLAAVGRPGVVALASGALGIVWIAVTALLLPIVGIVAIGIGNLIGALVEAFILDRATRRAAGVAPHRALLRPLIVAVVAGSAGYGVGVSAPTSIWSAILAAALTVGLAVGGLMLLCRNDFTDTLKLALSAIPSPQRVLRLLKR
jgi:PST family polysaccharide transporter